MINLLKTAFFGCALGSLAITGLAQEELEVIEIKPQVKTEKRIVIMDESGDTKDVPEFFKKLRRQHGEEIDIEIEEEHENGEGPGHMAAIHQLLNHLKIKLNGKPFDMHAAMQGDMSFLEHLDGPGGIHIDLNGQGFHLPINPQHMQRAHGLFQGLQGLKALHGGGVHGNHDKPCCEGCTCNKKNTKKRRAIVRKRVSKPKSGSQTFTWKGKADGKTWHAGVAPKSGHHVIESDEDVRIYVDKGDGKMQLIKPGQNKGFTFAKKDGGKTWHAYSSKPKTKNACPHCGTAPKRKAGNVHSFGFAPKAPTGPSATKRRAIYFGGGPEGPSFDAKVRKLKSFESKASKKAKKSKKSSKAKDDNMDRRLQKLSREIDELQEQLQKLRRRL